MAKLTGYEAIEYAEAAGLPLNKYSDPIEDAREDLTPAEARKVASEDPTLIWINPTEMQFVTRYYPADGCSGVDPEHARQHGQRYDSREQAEAAIREHLGADHGRWTDEAGTVCLHESDAEGCGGFAIVLEAR